MNQLRREQRLLQSAQHFEIVNLIVCYIIKIHWLDCPEEQNATA